MIHHIEQQQLSSSPYRTSVRFLGEAIRDRNMTKQANTDAIGSEYFRKLDLQKDEQIKAAHLSNDLESAIDSIKPLTILVSDELKTAFITKTGSYPTLFTSTVIIRGKEFQMEFTTANENSLNDMGCIQSLEDAHTYANHVLAAGNEFAWDELPVSTNSIN